MNINLDTAGTTIKKTIEPYVDQVRSQLNKLTTKNRNTVTCEVEMGKHAVRVNGVLIEEFWRKNSADTLTARLRAALDA